MSSSSSDMTLADYMAIAISPALIISLVGSLIFFLVEVLLGPHYPGQLLWILFFAVFGAVLVSRISMSSDISERAGMYGVILGVLVWIALMVYVKYPPQSRLAAFDWLVNGVLILITWWSAHRLTRDSTVIDDKDDTAGLGLLQAAGLESQEAKKPAAIEVEERKKRKRDPGGLTGWLARYRRYRQQVGSRPHAPGVWVVYFSLAALPLFGLGQSLIPVTDTGRRQYAFWLMAIYVGSGLGLLLTTSFLNLRRYLRQRSLQMPVAMTGVWLTGGILIIATLLTLGALIPRPNPEYALIDLGVLAGAKEREGSRNAQGKGWAKNKGDVAEGKGEGGKNKTAKGEGKKKGEGANTKDGQGKKGGQGQGKSGDRQSKQGGDAKDGDRQEQGNDEPDQEAGEASSTAPPPPVPLPEVASFFVNLLKWIVIGAIALAIAFMVGRAFLRFLANFTLWARGLLDGFQGLWNRLRAWWHKALPEAALDEPEPARAPRPFAAYPDPFLSGEAAQMTPAQLVRYTFDALGAWAHERGLERFVGETPLEFAERLGVEMPALEQPALDLANLYVGLAYARRKPTAERAQQLRGFWQLLVDLVERPMSAGVVE
jgi:hypothetical protein